MSEIQIYLDPPISISSDKEGSEIVSYEEAISVLGEDSEIHNLLIRIDGDIFGYYPAPLYEILNDLDGIIEAISGEDEAAISIAGYTVLLSRVVKDDVVFFEPQIGGGRVTDEIGVPIKLVRQQVRRLQQGISAYIREKR